MNRYVFSSLVACGSAGVLVHCGARTDLGGSTLDASTADAAADVQLVIDAPLDIRSGSIVDPAVDVSPPPIDSSFNDVVVPNDCPTADVTFIYLLSSSNDLLSFNPATLAVKTIGKIACPGAGNSTPHSMAVDRKGIAYAVFNDGKLYRLSTANAACVATSFVSGQEKFDPTFGMGFVADTNGPGEQLYVASYPTGLAKIDTSTFKLSFIGPFARTDGRSELTGTGAGRLFAYVIPLAGSGSRIEEIDKSSAKLIAQNNLKTGQANVAFAFAFWGGDFWLFNSPQNTTSTSVTRFKPSDTSETVVSTISQRIVGAGVSTCAPSN